MFKIHPEIPESLSLEAKSFILRCFEPDPNKRPIAADLLRDIFLRQTTKGKKSKIAFKPSGGRQINTPRSATTWTTLMLGSSVASETVATFLYLYFFMLTCLSCVFVFSDYIHSVSIPAQQQGEAAGSSSSEHGSVSPDCDSKHDVFFQRKRTSGSENLKTSSSSYLRSGQTQVTSQRRFRYQNISGRSSCTL